uniref:Uncharacterized protein n=1 Tax=Micrurus spixii TaxID=129469 RepID=A0A2D4N1H0_9SAUR
MVRVADYFRGLLKTIQIVAFTCGIISAKLLLSKLLFKAHLFRKQKRVIIMTSLRRMGIITGGALQNPQTQFTINLQLLIFFFKNFPFFFFEDHDLLERALNSSDRIKFGFLASSQICLEHRN